MKHTLKAYHAVTKTFRDFNGAPVAETELIDSVFATASGTYVGMRGERTVKMWFSADSVPQGIRAELSL